MGRSANDPTMKKTHLLHFTRLARCNVPKWHVFGRELFVRPVSKVLLIGAGKGDIEFP